MAYKESYKPETGCIVFAPIGYQRLRSTAQGAFYYLSETQIDILIQNKWQFSDCWASGDFYYIAGNHVIKKDHDANTLYSTILTSPVSVSTAQTAINGDTLSDVDDGCWISDNSLHKLIKTDSQLNEVYSLTGILNPSYVISTVDGGCYLFDDGNSLIIKISSSGVVQASVTYATIALVDSSEVKSADSDSENGLCILIDETLYRIEYEDGNLSLAGSANVITDLQTEGYATDISVDKTTNREYIYVVGCWNTGGWISKYDYNINVNGYNKNLTSLCPSLVQASQWEYSNALYIVSEEDDNYIPDECKSSSSSSSSSVCGDCCELTVVIIEGITGVFSVLNGAYNFIPSGYSAENGCEWIAHCNGLYNDCKIDDCLLYDYSNTYSGFGHIYSNNVLIGNLPVIEIIFNQWNPSTCALVATQTLAFVGNSAVECPEDATYGPDIYGSGATITSINCGN